jgi:tetratricopeptide (TPR) repeat protein
VQQRSVPAQVSLRYHGPMGCLSEDAVTGLLEGRLDPGTVRAATEHMDGCADCRDLVVEAVRCLDARETVGRYIVLDCIGAGAMGIVYTARDPDLGRKVALKLLRADPSAETSQGARARLLREAQAMAKLSHPNVIAIYDVGTVADEVFLAMELVEGGTLGDWMRVPRSWREVLAVMRRAGEGLAAAHDAGLVHRDFKPDNVLVGADGRVRVTDFGLARATEDPSSERGQGHATDVAATATRTGALVGTPAYMAPEQIAGHVADARSDVFSFCVTFYEALYGERPFAGTTLVGIAEAVRRQEIRPVAAGNRVPSWLRRVVVRGLQALPAERPGSIRALLDAIDAGSARARLRTALAALSLLVAALVAGVAALQRVGHGRPPGGGSAMAQAAPRPVAVTDLPMPGSARPDALAAYARGLQGMRDGTWGAADFERAAQLDPSLAAAHLRYALLEFWQLPTEGRQHLAKAVEGRPSLDEHDQLLLRAAEAWMQSEPTDDAAFVRLVGEAQARYPLDAEIAYYAGFAQTQLADHAAAVAALDVAIALDPGFGAAYQLKADEQGYAGDLDGSLATIDQCVVRAPEATRCLMERAFLDESDGNCGRVEQDGRRMLAHDPDSDMAYPMLALASYAQGRPLETARELLRQGDTRVAPARQHRSALRHEYELDVLTGDFDGARDRALELGVTASASPDRRLRATAALLYGDASIESGRSADAARVARDFLAHEGAWSAEPRSDDFAVLRDSTPSLWIAERRGGLLSPTAFEVERDAWVRGWESRLPGPYRPYAWLHGFARVAETREDAEKALAELPRFGPIPRFTPLTFGDAFVGRTYLLAGRAAEALPYLRRAARSCLAVEHPIEHTQVQLALGRAATQAGEPGARAEACAAYGVVLARWGTARPRSVTAEAARSLAASLGCR